MTFFLILLVFLIILASFFYQKKKQEINRKKKPLQKIILHDGYLIGHYLDNGLLKGKKIVAGILFSEGTFYKGLQIGQGQEYYPNGIVKYKGYFENGLASGQGKLYEENGRLKYIGNFDKGYASGFGKIFDDQGHLKIEGNFKKLEGFDNRLKDPSGPSGRCREYYQNGKIKYDGEFRNGIYNGYGSLYNNNGGLIYKGNFYQGNPIKNK